MSAAYAPKECGGSARRYRRLGARTIIWGFRLSPFGFRSCDLHLAKAESRQPTSDFRSDLHTNRVILYAMTTLALTELLGATVYDPSGAAGRVREVALAPQEDRARIASLVIKTKTGNRILPFAAVSAIEGGIRATTAAGEWAAANGAEGLFLLERDLLDQQVI